MNRASLRRSDACFCGSGKTFKNCCHLRWLPDSSKLSAIEEMQAIYRFMSQSDDDPTDYENLIISNVHVGKTQMVCAPLPDEGEELPGTLAPSTPSQIETKYKAIRKSNKAGATEVVVTYTYPEIFGHAEVRAVFPADQKFQLPNRRVVSVLDLSPGMQIKMASGAIGTISGSPELRREIPLPPLPEPDGLWKSRVMGSVKHTTYEIVEFRWAGQVCRVTPGHAVWSASRRGWVGAHELYPGEKIRVAENVIAPVEGLRRIPGRFEVFGIEVEYFHNYFVGTGPNAMLVHNGPRCLDKPAVAEALEEGAINRTGRRAAGVLTEAELNPQHHIFPQGRRQWFADRGVDVDQFTVRLDRTTHDAFHAGGGPGRGGGWWNDQMMTTLTQREATIGRNLMPSEIQGIGNQIMQRFGIGGLPIGPYGG
jgi:hypothetical protein